MPNKAKRIVSTITLSFVLSSGIMYATQPTVYAMDDNSYVLSNEATNPHAMREHRTNSIYDEAASVLNMDKQTLQKELQSGKSLVDVAKSKNVSEQKLKTALLSKQSARIDQAVKSGKLSSDKADMMKKHMNSFIDNMMNKKGIMQHDHQRMLNPSEDKLAKQLGLTVDEFRSKLKSGKSISELAAEKGISKDQLIRSIKEDLTPMIERMIDHKYKAN